MKKKLVSIGLMLAMACSAAVMSGCGEEEVTYTPTFMYFVSTADEDYDTAMEAYETLQTEYEGEVNFDLHDIDENPEDKENFPVEGNTPALIMLNTSNDISAMEFSCSDVDTLREQIEIALNK